MRRAAAPLVALVAAACGASNAPESHASATPSPAAKPPFTDVSADCGIAAVNHTGTPGVKPWIATAMGGGVIVLDYDQDGRMDLVVVDGTMLTEDGKLEFSDEARTRVYHNDGGLKFHETTKQCGVDLQAFGIGGASCDYDGDGWPDFYVCCWGKNRLFHNRGDGTFEELAEKAGVAGGADDFSTGCCFGDVNGDGIVDLYVSNYADQREFIDAVKTGGRSARRRWHGIDVFRGPLGLKGQSDRLYFGNGDGTFHDVTATNLSAVGDEGYGFQPVMTDVDGDGDLDVFVANDISSNFLWINDGHGKFAAGGYGTGTATDDVGQAQASMGVDVADVNRDGRVDFVVTNFSQDHDTIFVNHTAHADRPLFRDESSEFGVIAPSFHRVSWGVKLLDYDGDGTLDLFIACGHIYPEVDSFPAVGDSYKERCLLLHGVGPPNWSFADVSETSGPFFHDERVWRGAAFADFDNDGDLDVFVTALNDKPALLRNDVGNLNSWLAFRLIGKKPRDPSGARVTVFLEDGLPRMEELHHGASFCGDNDPRLFFGLGKETAAKRVEVRWPDGAKQSFENVAARKHYVLEEGGAPREDKR